MNATVLRFMSKVAVQDGCWKWTAATSGNGYGAFKLNGRQRGAHCIAYELFVGIVPAGLELDHLCGNRRCVNPAHLEPVPHRENVRRGRLAETTRERSAQRTHCKWGHEYTDSNTRLKRLANGYIARVCRVCQRKPAAL